MKSHTSCYIAERYLGGAFVSNLLRASTSVMPGFYFFSLSEKCIISLGLDEQLRTKQSKGVLEV